MKLRLLFSRLVASALVWVAFETTHLGAIGQEPTPALPVVSAAPVPLYPILARTTNTQGVVHVRIRTDGHKVVEALAEEKNRLLTLPAVDNAKNWEF